VSQQTIGNTDEPQHWRRLLRTRNWIIAVWLAALAGTLIAFPLLGVLTISNNWVFGALTVLGTGVLGGACVGLIFQGSLEKQLKLTLESNDTSNLAYWIQTLYAPASLLGYPQMISEYQTKVRSKLLIHMSGLTEVTAYILSSDDRALLYRTLKGQDVELIREVLRVVPILADESAMPYVRHLAKGRGLAANDPELERLAQSTLEVLRSRIQTGTATGLLRACSRPLTAEHELLVPANARSESEAEELLRGGSRE